MVVNFHSTTASCALRLAAIIETGLLLG